MKKALLTLTIAVVASVYCSKSNAQAMWNPDGTVLTDFTYTDLNGASYKLFNDINDKGKHLIVDFSATWCGPCWAYHQSGVLDTYFDMYGKNGSVGDISQVVLYEVDQQTTLADLQGPTGNSQGDWITGTTHPISNPASPTLVSKFLAPGVNSYGIPAVFVVCQDHKMYQISTGITDITTLRDYVVSKCGTSLGVNEMVDLGFTFEISPNPATTSTTIHLNLDEAKTVSYSLKNTLGEEVAAQASTNLEVGKHNLDINTSGLATGLYFVSLNVGNRNINARIVVNN
jgi:hypothetical protein